MAWDQLIPLIAILPLAGFAITALIGRRLGKRAHWIPVVAVLAVWLIAMATAYSSLTGAAPFGEHGYGHSLFTWIPAGAFGVTPAGAPPLSAQGSVIALMVMAVAAAEATVGLAIVIAIYRNKKTPLVDEYDAMSQ